MKRNKIFLAMSVLIASTTIAKATDTFQTDSSDGYETASAENNRSTHQGRRGRGRGRWDRFFRSSGGRGSSGSRGGPDAATDTATTIVDAPTTIDLLANDTGTGLKLQSVYQNTAFGGTTTTSEGVVTYNPPAGFTGTDEFWYVVVDANDRTNRARVTVEVGAVTAATTEFTDVLDTETEATVTDTALTDTGLIDTGVTQVTTGESTSTAGVSCDYSESAFNDSEAVAAEASSNWSCSDSERIMMANGLPDHAVTLPSDAPNTITERGVFSIFTLTPTKTETSTTPDVIGYVLNGVKIDGVTAGSCNFTGDSCSLTDNSGSWSIEATRKTRTDETETPTFDFGSDGNNGYVQADGSYTYHGLPLGFLENQGASDAVMTLIGWAADGFPIYGSHGHSDPGDAESALKVMTGSYQQVDTSDETNNTRPATDTYPLGSFTQDWQYIAGSTGDLDECNGRTGVTPEFPNGIYHYFATETFPFVPRCVKGVIEEEGTVVDTVLDTTVLTEQDTVETSVDDAIVTPEEAAFNESIVDDTIVVTEETTAQNTDAFTEEAMAIAAEAAIAIAAENN